MSFPFRRAPTEFRRKVKERKEEDKRAKSENTTSADFQNIKNRLGFTQKAKDWKVKRELKRLSNKKPKTWKAIGLTANDFKAYGIKV